MNCQCLAEGGHHIEDTEQKCGWQVTKGPRVLDLVPIEQKWNVTP
jgi:hypothetical protein